MVDDVIQDEAAKSGCARKRENGFAAGLQGEDFLQIFVARLSDGGAGGSDVLVEIFEELFAGGHDVGLSRRRAGRAKVERFALKGEWDEGRQFDEVASEAADGHGFIVGFRSVLVWVRVESLWGGAHFVIEFR